MPNRLIHETSPYLRQHAQNPVDWYPWGAEAFQSARDGDRPVLLSVGYSACHWCHVMAHESFEDAEIASLMNERFVNVKVDREERPDVDTVYMQAVQGMTGHGGWPMTVFLTPDGTPYFGGTYFPPEERHGLPAFRRVLEAASDAYRTRRDEITAAGERMRTALATPRLAAGSEPSAAQLDTAARTLAAQTDRRNGGFGGAPKFPHPMALDLLLRRFVRSGDRALADAAVITLDAMARGGIHDQAGGGFHRYSVDARWAVPHFEKMLYDNAQLVMPYLHAHQLGLGEGMRDVCVRTLDYLQREMTVSSGGFAASQDADTADGEGAYFVWSPAALREVLDAGDAALAMRVFGVTEAGNFEDNTTVLSVPYPLEQVALALQIPHAALRDRVDAIRGGLRAARSSRTAPARDDKVITSWNALAVKAFAECGAALDREDYLQIARRTANFLIDALMVDGVVMRTWKDGEARIVGFLEDVAHLADALLTVYECSGEPRFFDHARSLCVQIVERYRDASGTYYDTARDADPLIVRPRTLEDNPVMSGQAAAASAFLRLHAFTGDATWRDRALEIIELLAVALPRAPLALAGLGCAMELAVERVREVAIAGDNGDERTRMLVRTVTTRFDPVRVLAWGPAGGVPLLEDRVPVRGMPTAYVCEQFTCAAPVTDAEALAALLTSSEDVRDQPQ